MNAANSSTGGDAGSVDHAHLGLSAFAVPLRSSIVSVAVTDGAPANSCTADSVSDRYLTKGARASGQALRITDDRREPEGTHHRRRTPL